MPNIYDIFEGIIQKYEDPMVSPSLGPECDNEFFNAMEEHLTREQRLRLYETNGGCMGTGHAKKRKNFALEYAHLDLDERMELYAKTFGGRKPVLKNDNTISVTFTCAHRFGKVKRDKIKNSPPPPIDESFLILHRQAQNPSAVRTAPALPVYKCFAAYTEKKKIQRSS